MQLVLVEMQEEVDRICKKNGIQYYIIGGTLLGAVRHGGFIPWDDDLDIGMQRGEYERFRKACETDIDASRYFFQDHTNDPYYRWGYGKFRRKNSEFLRCGQEHLKMKTGIFIDVFVVDNVSPHLLVRLPQTLYCYVLRKILYSETGKVTGKNALIRAGYRLLSHIPATWAFKRLNNAARRWNARSSTKVRSLTFPAPKGSGFCYEKRFYEEPPRLYEFEGRRFPGIRDAEAYLSMKYGDYMALPPENKRKWHPVSKFRLPPKD